MNTEKPDTVEIYEDKFRALRVAYITVLEESMDTGQVTLNEAVRLFSRANLMSKEDAGNYLQLMSGPDSRFKILSNFRVS